MAYVYLHTTLSPEALYPVFSL